MTRRAEYKVLLWLLFLWLPLPLCAQVDICYDFEDCPGNSRPMGWGALPNLDFHYVGIDAYDNTAHTGSKSLKNNGCRCFTIMPDDGINYGADGVWLSFWYYLHLNTDYFDVGYLTNPTDSTTFHLLATVHGWQQQWHFFAVDLSSVPTGARIAFFGHDLFCADGTFWLDDMHLTSQPRAAWGLRVAENRADSVRLEWQSVGYLPTLTITTNNGTYTPLGNSLTVPHQPNYTYTATLSCSFPVTVCMPAQPYSEQAGVYAYRAGSCLDATDFNSSMAVPYHGTPVEPYLHVGTYTTNTSGVSGVFAGSHTVNTFSGSDGGGMMVFPRTIPPGDNVTLRLGNRLGDWESDAMLYTIDVDTNETDLLVMKYTVAMAFGTFQGPEEAHRSDTLHPAWFRIELMDDNLQQTADDCQQFYIDMWDTDGWDEMNNMYKRRDFTGKAFDLTPYHGRRLHLRVTACDGAVNNRWCYAYYNFSCLKSNEVVSECTGDSVELTVPYGFLYRWWRDGVGGTISTDRTVTVPIDGGLYHCELTDRFNSACSYIVSRQVLSGTLLTVRDTVVENDLPHTYRDMTFNGAIDTMFTVPAALGCDTVVHYVLHVWPNRNSRQVLRVCPNEWPVVWYDHTFSRPDSVAVTFTDIHGADSTVTLVAVEAPAYEVGDTMVICPGRPFVWGGVDYGGPVAFDTLLTTVDGCDSLVHVTLVERDSNFTPRAFHSTDLRHWADTVPIALCTNQTLHVVDSTVGAVFWQWTLEVDDSLQSVASSRQADFDFSLSTFHSNLTLVVSSEGGCEDTLRWPVLVFQAPAAEFAWTPEKPADINPEVQLLNYTRPDSCRWMWLVQGGEGVDTLTDFSPNYRWLSSSPTQGSYGITLVATVEGRYDTVIHTCVDSVRHEVEVVTDWLQFPTLVTPNGDGHNDRWEVVNLVELGQYPMNELWIYNQWGILVFHARDVYRQEDFWDPDATASPDGTYYYRFMGKNAYGIVRRNGVIEVLR